MMVVGQSNDLNQSGPFYVSSQNWGSNGVRGGDYDRGLGWRESFDASRVVPTASENRPYTIYALPLIAY